MTLFRCAAYRGENFNTGLFLETIGRQILETFSDKLSFTLILVSIALAHSTVTGGFDTIYLLLALINGFKKLYVPVLKKPVWLCIYCSFFRLKFEGKNWTSQL